MSKHTPGPWFNREGTILADTREQVCCGRPCVGAEYMGQQEMVCCGNPDVDGDEEDPIATVKYEHDIPLVIAAPDLLEAAKLVLAWYEAEENHGTTDFYERIAMCKRSEDAIRAAISKATGG